MLDFIKENALWIAPIFSFVVAQFLKYVIYAIQYNVLRKERLTGAGGMPSSHSSGVCTLVVVIARSSQGGASSPMFALALIFALVVMYDAAGVRRAAGLHAKVINALRVSIDDLGNGRRLDEAATSFGEIMQKKEEPENIPPGHKPLKEFVGHTPLEVFCGAVLGILIGFLFELV